MNRGNPTRGPARAPEREDDQLDRAVARLANPAEYASLLFCAHHGARASFASFHARRRLNAENDTGGELVLADVVGALGGPLVEVGADQREAPVVSEPLRAAMGAERLGLRLGRVQREQESPDHPTHPSVGRYVQLYIGDVA